MRDYEGWSFRDRSFAFALFLSAAWHLFWFFTVTITVNPAKGHFKPRPGIVSLGPVLDDAIFRTLAATKPQLSQTFYRRLTDFSPPVELKPQTIERRSPGDVVSVPFGRKFSSPVRDLMSGDKASPEYEFISRFNLPDETPDEEEKKRRHLI